MAAANGAMTSQIAMVISIAILYPTVSRPKCGAMIPQKIISSQELKKKPPVAAGIAKNPISHLPKPYIERNTFRYFFSTALRSILSNILKPTRMGINGHQDPIPARRAPPAERKRRLVERRQHIKLRGPTV